MARPYSQKFLLVLNKNETVTPGTELAKLCVENNLPASYVAKVLDISRMTLYSWFRGKSIRVSLLGKVEAFTHLVQKDVIDGKLPAKGNIDAKLYLEAMIGARL